MSEVDPGWKPYQERSEFDRATQSEALAEMFRHMMEVANQEGGKAFVMCNWTQQVDGDRALYSPEYEGEIIGVEEGEGDNFLLLKDVRVMQLEESDDPREVIKYTTLEHLETLQIPISNIADVLGSGSRFSDD